MKKINLVLAFVFTVIGHSFAQSTYKSAIGGRLATGYYDLFSASYKFYLGDSPEALEFNLGFKPYSAGYNWVNFSTAVSYQYHFDIQPAPGLKWFIGGGLQAYNSFSSNPAYSGFGLSIFPTGGLDYKFSEIPLNLSFDFRPNIQLIKPYDYYDNFQFAVFGISARYTLK
jgi:hypothetical protein